MNNLQFYFILPALLKEINALPIEKRNRELKKLKLFGAAGYTYQVKVSKEYAKHSTKANETAFEEVIKGVKNGLTNITKEYEKSYRSVPVTDQFRSLLKQQTRKSYIAEKKRSLRKATSYELNLIDVRTINTLSQSDLLWIKNHAADSPLMRQMQAEINDMLKETRLFMKDDENILIRFDHHYITYEEFKAKLIEYGVIPIIMAGNVQGDSKLDSKYRKSKKKSKNKVRF
jgi:hypothetical protein